MLRVFACSAVICAGILACLSVSASPQDRCYQGGCQQGPGVMHTAQGGLYLGAFSAGKFHGEGYWSSPSQLYKGQFAQGQRSGLGTLAESIGNFYQGQWQAHVLHGHGVEITSRGDIYIGQWQKGKKQGQGVLYGADGSIKKGEFNDNRWVKEIAALPALAFQRLQGNGESYLGFVNSQGQPEGYGTWIGAQGKVSGRGLFRNGLPQDPFFVSAPERYYLGNLDKMLMHGSGGILHWKNGNRYLGGFHQDQLQGKGLLALNNQETYYGDFKNGVPDGQGTVYLPNGDIFTGEFSKGLKHGPGTLQQGTNRHALHFNQGQPVSTQAPAASSDATRLRNHKAQLRQKGMETLLDLEVEHKTHLLLAHAGYVRLKAGAACELLVGGPPGVDNVGFKVSGPRDITSEWVLSSYSERFVGQRFEVERAGMYAVWVKGLSRKMTTIPIYVLLACS